MKSSQLIQGTRAQIEAELTALGKEAAGKGKPDKAREFAAALALLADDAPHVRVRSAVYRVVRDGDDWM
jgi:hypothetical protein